MRMVHGCSCNVMGSIWVSNPFRNKPYEAIATAVNMKMSDGLMCRTGDKQGANGGGIC
jgi:hypothetical protein